MVITLSVKFNAFPERGEAEMKLTYKHDVHVLPLTMHSFSKHNKSRELKASSHFMSFSFLNETKTVYKQCESAKNRSINQR